MIDAISQADELATALPSVAFYDGVAAILAEGLSNQARQEKPALIYAAENHNHAAELLERSVRSCAAGADLSPVQFVNTVIGKMSGVIDDAAEIDRLSLAQLTPAIGKAVLVEEFNRIFISRVRLDDFARGIGVFIEKDDLLPFEEAKLYGHNAIHALIGYLAQKRGLRTMAVVRGHLDVLGCAREAFLNESGAALISKHAGLDEPLFTVSGYAEYCDDLLRRMLNPHLNDLVARVVRDPKRKLGYDDRFFGTMRLALSCGIVPANLARGAAVALEYLAHLDHICINSQAEVSQQLNTIWGDAGAGDTNARILKALVWKAMQR
jgi:mannitol-1-phosphate 5-dehydrogenase